MEKQYAFYEGYLAMQMPHYHCEFEYAHCTEAKESKSSFYLKKPEGVYIQLPKKCFTIEQVEALRELFTRKYGLKFKGMK